MHECFCVRVYVSVLIICFKVEDFNIHAILSVGYAFFYFVLSEIAIRKLIKPQSDMSIFSPM